MKKRIWSKAVSIFTAILLVVGFVPNMTVAVMAADNDKPNNLYVGTTNIAITPYDDNAAYWTSDDGITWTSQTDKPTADSYIHYDGNGTLTLHNVSIQGDYTDYTLGYGIYAMSSSGPVSLSIVLEEKNNVSGVYGITVSSDGGYASLNISGPGSLTVSSPNYNGIGIFMSSKTSDANLTIEGASVTASGNQSGGSGVRLITSQTGSPNLTIAVKGGSLQASGASNGIHFLSNTNDATAVANLQVSGNAMVKASNISTTKDGTGQAPELTTGAGASNTGGIVFDGTEGTVYGDVTLDESLTINQGETLTIPEGSTLNTNNNLTNNGTIVNTGGTLNGEPGGTIISAPTITSQPISQTVEEGDPATFTITASGNDLQYLWQKSADNGISWIKADGAATEATYAIEAATTGMNGLQYRCVVWNDAGSVNSDAATLTVDAHKHSLKHYEYKAPTCTENGNEEYWYCESCKQYFSDENATMPIAQEDTVIAATGHAYGEPTWEWSKDGQSATATFICDNDESHQESKEASITSAVKEEATCTEDGITVYTATVEFNGQTYTDTKEIADLPATGHQLTKVDGKVQTIEETGNITYWHCEICDKYFSDENGEHEISLEDTILAKLPKLLEGADQVWTKGSKDGMVWRIQEDPQAFKRVLVDGKELKDTEYTVTSGSTIITLQPSYLDTLSAGQHKIRFEFITGNIETHFTIKDAEKATQSESTDTGLQNHLGLWISICMAAASGLFAMMILVRRKER